MAYYERLDNGWYYVDGKTRLGPTSSMNLLREQVKASGKNPKAPKGAPPKPAKASTEK